MLLSLREWRARASAEAALRADLKARIARIFGLGPEDAVTVSEIVCADPGCPDAETVILVMCAGEPTRALKMPVAMANLTDAEIECLAAQRISDDGASAATR